MDIKKLLRDKDERGLLANIGLAFLIKGLALIISTFSMPLYIKYFDDHVVLGLWYTILSLLSWVQLFDLGLGNGLRNKLTEALAVGDYDTAKKSVSSTYMALGVVIFPIAVIGCVLFRFLDLNAFFNVSESLVSQQTMCVTVTVLFCGICLNFILKTINVVIYAIQKSSLNNAIALVTSVLPLIYIGLFKGNSLQENLVSLTVVHLVASNLPLLVASIVLFGSKILRPVAPSWSACNFRTAKSMLNFGMQFFLAQIFFMGITATNEIVITKMFSAADVVHYSIYYRLFTVAGSLFMLALTPLWSKVTKDLAQKKYRKIRMTNRVLYALSGLAAVAEFAMVAVLQFVVDLWLQDEAITINHITGLIFAFYGSMYILNVVLTTVANGMGDLRTQIIFYGIFAVLKIPSVYLLSFAGWTIVVLYNAVAMCAFCGFQLVWIERKLKKLVVEQPTPQISEENV